MKCVKKTKFKVTESWNKFRDTLAGNKKLNLQISSAKIQEAYLFLYLLDQVSVLLDTPNLYGAFTLNLSTKNLITQTLLLPVLS